MPPPCANPHLQTKPNTSKDFPPALARIPRRDTRQCLPKWNGLSNITGRKTIRPEVLITQSLINPLIAANCPGMAYNLPFTDYNYFTIKNKIMNIIVSFTLLLLLMLLPLMKKRKKLG